jgi:pSer/pThr/pTyr-binding forkhead associated (FHA) protein
MATTISKQPQKESQEKKPTTGVKLEILSGPSDGLEFELTKDVVLIGREINTDIALPLEISLSRAHARLSQNKGEFWLEDLNSNHGTYIGGQKVTKKVKLLPGTIFKAGDCEMRIVAE